MIKTQPAASSADMTKAQAKALTDRIRSAVDELWSLLLEAHERKAWKALGYRAWDEYVRAEFGMTRQRSYQLLDQGRVIEAVKEATGNLSTSVDISEAAARDVKHDLPVVTADIKARVEKGEAPAKAAAEAVSAARANKEKAREERKAKQAENDAFREANRARLAAENPRIAAIEAAKERNGSSHAAVAKGERSTQERIEALEAEIEELREANASLEAENKSLKAELKTFSEMKVEFEKGGFAEVIAGKDEVIRAQLTRIEAESRDKVAWKRRSDFFRAEAVKLGWSNTEEIELEPAGS